MSKVDISPYLPQIDAAILDMITNFKFYKPMKVLGIVGQVIDEAEELQTEEDYKDAWNQLTVYVESKYDLFQKLDDLIKLPFYLEPFDKMAFKKAWDATGAALAYAASKYLEDNTTTP